MTKIKQMLCALLTVCLLLIGSTNAMAAQPDTPSHQRQRQRKH